MTAEQCAEMGREMGQMMGGMMGQMMSGGMMGGGWSWGGIVWFGLLALLVLAVGVAMFAVVARRPAAPAGEDPREILRRRFAQGEVSADEFAAAMKALS